MYRTDFWTLWEKVRVGWSERIVLKHAFYEVWNRSPVQIGCMRQELRAGAIGWPREMGWGGRWERSTGWGTHVNPWLIHVNVWQKPLQYCKVISLQLIKINGKKKGTDKFAHILSLTSYSLSTCCSVLLKSWEDGRKVGQEKQELKHQNINRRKGRKGRMGRWKAAPCNTRAAEMI